MEVASPPPAPFGSRAKRHYPGSPGFVDSTNRNPFATIPGDSSDEYMQQRSFKRRRFLTPDESMGTETENNQNHAFMQFQHQPSMAKGSSSSFTTHGKSITLHDASCGFSPWRLAGTCRRGAYYIWPIKRFPSLEVSANLFPVSGLFINFTSNPKSYQSS